jgi:hypothetical protein
MVYSLLYLSRFTTSGIRALSWARSGRIFFKHNFINVNLAKILQVPTKNIQSTYVEGENVQIFKDLNITMDKYVLHLDFLYYRYG